MKTLLLLLALAFLPDPVVSKKVEVYTAGENHHVTLQSIRDGDDYSLRIEITSPTWQVGHGPCETTFQIETNSLAVPCAVSSKEVIRSRPSTRFVVESITISDSIAVQSLLHSEQPATVQIGPYDLKLTKSRLRELAAVLE